MRSFLKSVYHVHRLIGNPFLFGMGYCRVMDNVGYCIMMHNMGDGRNGFLVSHSLMVDSGRNRNSLGMPAPTFSREKVSIIMSLNLIFAPSVKILMAYIAEIMYF